GRPRTRCLPRRGAAGAPSGLAHRQAAVGCPRRRQAARQGRSIPSARPPCAWREGNRADRGSWPALLYRPLSTGLRQSSRPRWDRLQLCGLALPAYPRQRVGDLAGLPTFGDMSPVSEGTPLQGLRSVVFWVEVAPTPILPKLECSKE